MTSQHIIVTQIIVALLLSTSILMQGRGTGLSASFGGDGSSYYSKRGFEKFLLFSSIFLAVLFVGLAWFNTFVLQGVR
jgi:protein translocase SecG subunit